MSFTADDSEKVTLQLMAKWRLKSDGPQPVAMPKAETVFSDKAYDSVMTVQREELDAKLEAVEARMDARVAGLIGRMDAMLERMDGREAVNAQRAQNIEDRFNQVIEAAKGTQAQVSSFKTTLIVTAISTVLAIVLGIAAFNSTVLSNMVASFESGRNTAEAVSKATEALRQLEAQKAATTTPPAQPASVR